MQERQTGDGAALRGGRVRRCQDPVPILFSPEGSRFIVLEGDGAINENPGFKIRP